MRSLILFICIFLFCCLFSQAQISLSWQRTDSANGQPVYDRNAIMTNDGSVILTYTQLYTHLNFNNCYKYVVKKIDSQGFLQWEKYYPYNYMTYPGVVSTTTNSDVMSDSSGNLYFTYEVTSASHKYASTVLDQYGNELMVDSSTHIQYFAAIDSDNSCYIVQEGDADTLYIRKYNAQHQFQWQDTLPPLQQYFSYGIPKKITGVDGLYIGYPNGLRKINPNGTADLLYTFTVVQNPVSDHWYFQGIIQHHHVWLHQVDNPLGNLEERLSLRDSTGIFESEVPLDFTEPELYNLFTDSSNFIWTYARTDSMSIFKKYDSTLSAQWRIALPFQSPLIDWIWPSPPINNKLYFVNDIMNTPAPAIFKVSSIDGTGGIQTLYSGQYADSLGYSLYFGVSATGFRLANNRPSGFLTISANILSLQPSITTLGFNCDELTYSGNTYYDANSNGVKDSSTDVGLFGQRLYTVPDSNAYFTDIRGNYRISTDTSHSITVYIDNSTGFGLSTDSLCYTLTPNISSTCCYDFGETETSPVHSVEVRDWLTTASCYEFADEILQVNSNSNVPESLTLQYIPDTSINILAVEPPPDSSTSSFLAWNIDSLFPSQSRIYHVTYYLPANFTPGDSLNFHFTVLPQNSNTPIHDYHQEIPVMCGYDPNFKEVKPIGIGTTHLTPVTDTLEYTIHFQNTGNAPAHKVILIDSLDRQLDVTSLRIIGYSHPVNVRVMNGYVLYAEYDSIFLPDSSTDYLRSQGFFSYSILPKSGLPLPAVVKNSADIYFDYNLPVRTNEVYNTLEWPTGDSSLDASFSGITIFPNPTTGNIMVNWSNADFNPEYLNIFNVDGKLVSKTVLIHSDQQISVQAFSPGIYIADFVQGNHHLHKKFVKAK